MFLSVIVPCYNEEANLKRGVLDQIYDFLRKRDFTWEVLISDDGSTDKSVELVKSKIKDLKGFRLLENPHGGKPTALLYGIRAAKGEFILFTDMDQSTPISELDKLLRYTSGGFDAIIGSRGFTRKNFPFYRRLGAVVFSTFRRAIILPEIADTQCGFKLFKRNVLSENFEKIEFFREKKEAHGWTVTSWDIELLHILKNKGYKIIEVPVVWHDRDIGAKGKGFGLRKYIKESREMLGEILRVKLNDLRGLYKDI